jgi:hypothetical protein
MLFMRSLLYILLFALLLPVQVAGQVHIARSAINQIEKERFDKAEALIAKGLSKDSLNPEVKYVQAVLLFTNNYPGFQIDSAYKWVNYAIGAFDLADEKRMKKMGRLPLNELILEQLRINIDSVAFVRAKEIGTESAYNYFIQTFTSATLLDSAVWLRNEVAYATAKKINSFESYKSFFEKYPEATQVSEAKNRYEELLFIERTKDQKLVSFESFLAENPESPFRQVIIKNIFEISTAAADEKSYLDFIRRFESNVYTKRAVDILYHLRKENTDYADWLRGIATDSLRKIVTLDKHILFPFIWQGKYGFMNLAADEIIKPELSSLNGEYLCGYLSEDFLIHETMITARNGKVIYSGYFNDVEDIGFGFLLIQSRNCLFVIHKSGFKIGDACIEEAMIVDGSFLAQKKKHWALFTLTGKQLSSFQFKDIQQIEGLILIQFTNGKFGLYTKQQIAMLADGEQLNDQYVFDEIRVWSEGLLWLRNADREALIDNKLKYVIPLARQQLSKLRFGLMSKSNAGFQFPENQKLKESTYQEVLQGNNWLALKLNNEWQFWWQSLENLLPKRFDSVSVLGVAPIGHVNDSSFIILADGIPKYIDHKLNLRFLGAIEDSYFLLMDDRNRTYVYDDAGQRLFRHEYESIQPIAPGVFAIEQKGKKGLISLEGKVILKAEYTAFASSNQGAISTLKDRKFGLYSPINNHIISAEYERNLQFYNSDILIAYQNGFYAFIDWKNKPLSGFEFEAVELWNDSVAIVKQHFQWKLFDLKTMSFALSGIKSYKLIRNDEDEKIAIINHENGFGVISNINGTIIPPSFSDILNIGSATEPFYFTEKHVEEAEYFVVVYYNKKGEVVRRQAFESAEYDKIYCKQK